MTSKYVELSIIRDKLNKLSLHFYNTDYEELVNESFKLDEIIDDIDKLLKELENEAHN